MAIGLGVRYKDNWGYLMLAVWYKDKNIINTLAIRYKENGVVCVRKVARAWEN